MAESASAGSVSLRNGRIRIDRHARVVRVDGRPAKLGGRAFDLLDALVQRRDRVVPKQELLDVVWPGLIVEENNLQVHVMGLRKLLGADAIVTVSGRGYQFSLSPDRAVADERPEATANPPREDSSATVESPPSNTALIGRDELIASACALLRREDVRLLTLSGPGGSGKTRVGLRVTAELAHDFADGSYIVMLAPVRDLSRVAPTIAGVLGLQETDAKPIEDLMIDYLRDRSALLTLDNFEHLLGAIPLVERLLKECSRLKLLITSRAVLRIAGERELSVPPLPLPTLRATERQILQSPAVRLFVERARGAGRAIEDQPADVAAAADICRQLDGLPLAIELAAARLRVLTPPALAQRLTSRLSLLKTNAAITQRHRTLRDAIAWSYELLDADEQALFQRLAVFAGGWTLEAAEAIVGATGLTQDVLDVLSSLIDHNLVQRTEDVGGEARFAMLQTVREFANELFESHGEMDEIRQRHADYFVAFAERADPYLRSAGRALWLARMKADYYNLRAALSWVVIERQDAIPSLRLTGSLPWFWYFTGQFSEGRGWIKLALALRGADTAIAARAKVLSGEARLAAYSGAHADSLAAGTTSVDLFRQTNDRAGLAIALLHLGIRRAMAHERQSACECLEEATGHFRDLDDAWGIAVATMYHGSALAIEPGFEEEARRLLSEGRARGQALGDDWVVTPSSHYLGSIALRQGDYGLARKLTEEMLASARELGDAFRVSRILYQLSEIAMAQQQFDEARRHLRASLTLSREQGRLGDVAVNLRSLARIDAEQSQHERAVRIYGAASRLDTLATTIPTEDPEVHRRVEQALRTALGQRAYEAEWVTGATLSLEQAIALAMSSPHL